MWRLCAGLLATLCWVGVASAQDVAAKAQEAQALAGQGKFVEAMGALDEAMAVLWDRAPLVMRRALWVNEEPKGFGAYAPRDNNVFAVGAAMIAYAEPIGFAWRKSGDLWRTDLAMDMVLRAKDGSELARKNDFQQLKVASRVRNREFMTHFTYTFTGLPPGEYLVETTLRDKASGKSGTFALPFVLR